MSDLASRMAKQVNKDTAGPAKAEPFREAPKKHPHRITVDLSVEDYQALRRRAYEEHTGMSALLRGLIQLYIDDPELSARAKSAERRIQDKS